MACISNVNGEIILNFYFRHRLWAGLWCSIRSFGLTLMRTTDSCLLGNNTTALSLSGPLPQKCCTATNQRKSG